MGGVVFGQVVGRCSTRLRLRRRLRDRRLAPRPRLRRHLPGDSRRAPRRRAALRSRSETCMKITESPHPRRRMARQDRPAAAALLHQPDGPAGPGLIHGAQASMATFTFHGWLIVEVFTDSGHVGIGNAALSPLRDQGDHRSPPDAAAHRPGSVGHRVPLAAHVPQDDGLGPQGHRHGRDQRRRHRAVGRARQGRRSSRSIACSAAAPSRAFRSTPAACTARRSTSSRRRRARYKDAGYRR